MDSKRNGRSNNTSANNNNNAINATKKKSTPPLRVPSRSPPAATSTRASSSRTPGDDKQIAQFCAVTSCNDRSYALSLLEAFDWNVDEAVSSYMVMIHYQREPPMASSNIQAYIASTIDCFGATERFVCH